MDEYKDNGIGDPYWYEWYVGLRYILKMLYPSSNIKCVTLQASDIEGIDDVVVEHHDGTLICIQVKHTRTSDNLTFSDMFSTDNSLIRKIAQGWKKKSRDCDRCIPLLFTNREFSNNASGSFVSIKEFWFYVKKHVKNADILTNIDINEKWKASWNKCMSQLDILEDDDERLKFLKSFKIVTKQPDLEKLELRLINSIAKIFGIKDVNYTNLIFDRLVSALRIWSTTRRTKEYVDKEEVFKQLSLQNTSLNVSHFLPPPYPFFESRYKILQELSSTLLSGKYPIVFLKGDPGCGKSSMISELSNVENSVIYLRYHAFNPITADTKELPADYDKKTSAIRLWSDLLDQLRYNLYDNLAKYNIPIINEFLSVDQIRENVLRICNELYEDTNKTIVIAIDGIDHAARATYDKKIEETFLNLFIHPEKIPAGVCFLIAGQHPEGYPEYPIWLREKRDDVLHVEVPNITDSDIMMLIKKIMPTFNKDQIDPLARIIKEVANGNTLAAVFAVYEAKESSSLNNFEERLIKRKLHDGVSAYYNEIWSNALNRINTEVPFLNSKISAYIALSNQLFEGKILKSIYPEYHLTESDWTNVLRELQPLLIELEGEKFTLLHNDVRVHLMRELKLKNNVVKDVASLLADFYLTNQSCTEARHSDLFDLLQIAERSHELFGLFTPNYIMEAWTIRRPIEEIIEQSKTMINLAVNTKNWGCMNEVVISLKTVVQLINTKKNANEINYFKHSNGRVPTILNTERYITEQKRRYLYNLKEVIDDVQLLIKNELIDRASRLLKRWFIGTPEMVLSSIPKYEFNALEKEFKISNNVKSFLEDWGKVSIQTGFSFDVNSNDISMANLRCYNYFYLGVFKELADNGNKYRFIKYFKVYSKFLDQNNTKKLVIELARKEKWIEIKFILKQLSYEELLVNNKIIYAFLSIIICSDELIDKFVNPLLRLDFNIIDYKDYKEEEVYLFTMLCFIFGWGKCDIEQTAKHGTDYYFSNSRDLRTEELVLNLLASSASLGYFYNYLFYSNNDLSEEGTEILFSYITYFYNIKNSKLNHLPELWNIRSILFKLIIHCLKRCTERAYSLFITLLKAFMSENLNIHQEMKDIWEIFNALGEKSLIRELFICWTQKDGLAWKSQINKLDIVENYIDLAREFGMYEEAEELKERVGRNWIKLTNDYFPIGDSIKWIDALLKVSSTHWKEEGIKLLEVTKRAILPQNTINRIYGLLSIASAKDGPVQFGDFLLSVNMLEVKYFNIGGNKAIYDGIIGCLENGNFTEEELLSFWYLAIGGLTWRDRESRIYIEDTKKAVLKAGYRLGYYNLYKKLREKTPLCFNISQKKGRQGENHWIIKKDNDNVRVRTDEKLHKYSIDKIFDKFYYNYKKNASSRNTIAYANELIKRLKIEKTQSFEYYLEILTMFIIQLSRETYMSWEDIGLSLYHNFFCLIEFDSQGWRIIESISEDVKTEREIIEFTKKLENILFFRAEQIGETELTKVANLNVEMLRIWLNENEQSITNTNLMSSQYKNNEPNLTWQELIFDIIILNISCQSASQVEAGLQGLWQLIELNNNIIKRFNHIWGSLNYSGKEWLLLFFEKLAAEFPQYFPYIETIISDCFESNDNLLFKVQAWNILNTYQRVIGRKEIDLNKKVWTCKLKEELPKILNKLLYKKDSYEIEPLIHELIQGPVSYKLYQLQRVLNDNLINIQVDLLKALQKIEKDIEKNDSKMFIRDGDLYNSENKEINTLIEIVSRYFLEGYWSNKSSTNLFQAICYSEDPFVLLKSPSFVYDRNMWFNYYSLSNSMNATTKQRIEEKTLKSRFIKNMKSGINQDEIVICGQILFFAFDSDYIFTYELTDSNTRRTINQNGYNVGIDRSFVFYDKKRYEPYGMNDRLFINATPISRIPYASALMIPSIKLQNVLGLKTSNSNLLTFTKNGKKALWFENFVGPIRDEKDDNFYRQHILQRWVCTKEIYEILLKKINNIEFMYNLICKQLQFDMRDMSDEIIMYY